MIALIGIALAGVFTYLTIGTLTLLRRFADAVDPKGKHGRHKRTRWSR